MNDKTFLQELESIKRKLEAIINEYNSKDEEAICIALEEPINDIQAMINQCIEIQLMMMKQEKTKKLYDTKDF